MEEIDAQKRGGMTEEELLALIAQYEKDSLGSPVAAGATVGSTYYSATQQMTTLEIDRFNALNMFFARPLGNEIEGQSQVVIPEFRDTVLWIMPQLMRTFDAARTPCVFEPVSEEDVEQAQLETEAVRHVFLVQNNGFMVMHDLFMDALLLRNGYVKVYWREDEKTLTERYTGLTQDEVTDLLSDKADEQIEVLEQREYQVDMPGAQQMPAGEAPGAVMPYQPLTVFDLKVRRTASRGHVCIEAIPAEEMRVSNRARTNLDDAPFIEHQTTRTRSDLKADGYDAAKVDQAKAGKPDWMEMDALARDVVTDQLSGETPADRAMQEIELRDVTMRVDYDGDGIAELRHVLIAGDIILENEEIEEVPIASAVPLRMPHRHTGLSLYDLLSDIQVIKSQLVREGLTNLRLSNNGRMVVDWKNCNLTDLMTSRPGGVVRVNGAPGNVIMPLEHPSNLAQQVLPMVQELDRWRAYRTGIGEQALAMDADALQNAPSMPQMAGIAQAALKTEMIARFLAEGLKDVFVKIHALLRRHQDQPMQFKLRGKFVKLNPADWRERESVMPNVGLGSGNRPEARQNLILLGQAMKEMGQFGLVSPRQGYNWFRRSAMLLGEDQPEQFVMDPDSDEFKRWQAANPPQPNPAVIAAQTRLQAAQVTAQAGIQKAQMSEQAASQRAQAEVAHAALQGREDRLTQLAGMDVDMAIQLIKAIVPIVAAQYKQDPSANAGEVLRQDVTALEGRA